MPVLDRHALPRHGDHARRDGVDRPRRPLSRPDRGRAGQKLRTAAGTANVELPAYLAPFGYAVGLLQPGLNELPVKVWIAISATNTKERVQVVGPFDVVARTTITVDPADDNRFLSRDAVAVHGAGVPALEWTALGGDVVFGRTPAATCRRCRSAPAADRTVTGSTVIHIAFPGGGAIYMDCRPGATASTSTSRADVQAGAADAVRHRGRTAEHVLPELGRPPGGRRARELPRRLRPRDRPDADRLGTSGAAAQYTVGTPYTLPATSLNAVLSADTLATLRSVGGLVIAGKTYPVEVGVTIAATNTAEGVQTVRAAATYTPTAGLGPVVLPETTWTPTGAGPLRFTLAAPGAPRQRAPRSRTAASSSRSGPGRARDARLRGGGDRVANAAIPWSDAGRNGSAGRYAIEANPARPVFASAVDGQQPPSRPDDPQPTASPAPPNRRPRRRRLRSPRRPPGGSSRRG